MKSKIEVEFTKVVLEDEIEIEIDISELSFDIDRVTIHTGTLYQRIIEIEAYEKISGYPLKLFVTKTFDLDMETFAWEVHMKDFKTQQYLSLTIAKHFQNVCEEIITESLKLLPRNKRKGGE